MDAAAQDVQAMIAKTLRSLPQGIDPPSYRKTNPADKSIIYYGFTSSLMPMSTLDEYAETFMAQRISMVSGVAQVNVFGSSKYAVRVQLDPNALAHRQIGIDEVAEAINAQNVNMPTGVLNGPSKAYTLRANGQLDDAASFRRLVVTYRNGSPVRLGDIGEVLDDIQNNKAAAWFGQTRGVILAIQRQPGTNTVAVADAVRALMAQLKTQVPASVNISLLYDRSETIRESVTDVKFTLLLTLCLVIAVIFLFLRNVSATVIPSLALPISVIGTFAVMYLLDYSLDNLSLMALTLAVGFVVDDAIVMLENIVRHMEMGKPKMQAAIDGASEVGFTILSMTFSLAAVFIPFLFMGGIIGKLFHEFAVTIGVAILVSGFVSLTLTPMLSSRFLKSDHGKAHGRFYQMTERFYDAWLGLYERTLAWVMHRRPLTLAFSFVILVATGYLFWSTPKGLFPTDDTGQLLATTEAAEGVSFDALVEHQQEVAAVVVKDPDVRSVTSSVGTTAAANQGQLTIDLAPIAERKRSADQIGRDLAKAVQSVPNISVFIQNPPAISIGGLASKSLYQYTLQSGDINALNTSARELERRLRQLPGLTDVTSDLLIENPQVTVDIDREQSG
ncbi:MAG: efflux RND transporter permease subunit, partial [Gemmatimonadaceae bacterium]